jgi:hypothetical protein
MTTREVLDRQRRMFGGVTAAYVLAQAETQSERLAIALSLMSDVQELIALDRREDARQTLNRAKLLVAEAQHTEIR